MPDAPLLLGAIELLVSSDLVRLPDVFSRPFIDGGVMTIWLDGCIALWPHAAWATIAERVADLPLNAEGARSFARVLFASAVPFAGSPSSGGGHRRSRGPRGRRRPCGAVGAAALGRHR
jgi:hypothetical protein